MNLDEDQVLIRKILDGERACFEELMRKYGRKIYNFIFRMVREEETANELTQDFFIRIYTVLDKYNFEYRFSTWAYRICYNLVIDNIRKNQGQTDSLDDESILPRDLMQAEIYNKKDGFDEHVNTEIREYIWKVVEKIPLKFRELILLRYLQDLKYEEIAEITKLPVGTVKNRIFKAKEMLKQEIEKDGVLI